MQVIKNTTYQKAVVIQTTQLDNVKETPGKTYCYIYYMYIY